tara:strand:+ start:378 stop:509 length:132 start_codon:yes stop_codon:yes gene_type:complete
MGRGNYVEIFLVAKDFKVMTVELVCKGTKVIRVLQALWELKAS